MQPYGVKRQDSHCCPGHSKFARDTYRTRTSKKARARAKTQAHKRARAQAKQQLRRGQ